MTISDKLNGKKILIWGKGREGLSTERFIEQFCENVDYEFFVGGEDEVRFDDFDIVIKSPGIITEKEHSNMTSQTRLFMEQFSPQTIGITGTKGKSTTSSLLYRVLRDSLDREVVLVGNIGFPCFDYYKEMTEGALAVYEMSCHQLSDLETSPHIAVFLNLYEDHLDRYKTMDRYYAAKKNITAHQGSDDILFIGNDVPETPTKAKKINISYSDAMDFDMKLKGDHNKFNATIVYKIATELFGLKDGDVRASISEFQGLSHRLENIGTINGVTYYNDSISTIPEATIRAVESIKNTKTVIVGGLDRTINYDKLIAFMKERTDLFFICTYKTGERIYEEVKDLKHCSYRNDLKEAVELAKEITPNGSSCVFSPAAASYGYFKNFEERGDYFRRQVLSDSEQTLVFTGDIGFDKYMDGRWKDEELLSSDIKDVLKSADHVITNVEGPIMRSDKEEVTEGVKQLLHSMDIEVADFLKGIGSDIWNICNNHIMDEGEAGIKSTLKEARARGVKTLGAGININEARKAVYIDEAGGIGMIGVGYQRACRKADKDKAGCFSWSDLDAIKVAIAEIKATCRWCIVVAHAGEEFTPLPSPYTRERFHLYLEMGADIVVSHHPHVPMNYETVGDKIIFYSLGNFIFDTDYQRSQFNTEKGIMIKLKLTKEKFEFEAYGIDIVRGEEKIKIGDLPRIFRDVPEEEYKLLSPLSTKMHIAATRRQMTYLDPKRFKDATEEEWAEHFAEPLRTGRVPGETLDFHILCPLAEEAEKGEWKKSKMKDIVDYILEQM